MKKYLILAILILAFALRFWKLDTYPALNADEASIGYDAYSLIQTGRDQHGNSWPIHFQSFNDYKPGGYVYMVLSFVKLFGLNEWSVRIPSAFLGVLSVYVLYLLVLELKIKNPEIAAGFLAISPWHLHFSRGGWEVNVATFFILVGVYLFLKFVNSNKWFYLSLSFLAFVFSLYTYHSARLITPLLGLGLVLIYRIDFFKKENLKTIILNSLFLILLVIPLARDMIKPEISSRASGVGILADAGPLNRVNEQRGQHDNFEGLVSKTVHNKYINYGLAFLNNYTKHFHGLFLFLSGDDIQRNKVPETGQMYLFDLVFVLIGLWLIVKEFNNKPYQLVGYWLLISPIAAALTFQSPHALRAQNMVIPLVIISSIGFTYILSLFPKFSIWHIAFIFLIIWQFARYQHMYWVHMAKEYPFSSQYGLHELVDYLNSGVGDQYKNYIVTDRYDQPYILVLFYGASTNPSKYDPKTFQGDHKLTPRDQYGFSTVRGFGKYVFTSIRKWEETRQMYKNSLVAGTDEEIYPSTNVVKEIYGSNGYKYFQIIAN